MAVAVDAYGGGDVEQNKYKTSSFHTQSQDIINNSSNNPRNFAAKNSRVAASM